MPGDSKASGAGAFCDLMAAKMIASVMSLSGNDAPNDDGTFTRFFFTSASLCSLGDLCEKQFLGSDGAHRQCAEASKEALIAEVAEGTEARREKPPWVVFRMTSGPFTAMT
jgi:hypothetical protein